MQSFLMPVSVALFLLAFQTLFGFLYSFAVFGQIAVDEFILDFFIAINNGFLNFFITTDDRFLDTFITTNYLFGDFFVCLHQF